MIKQILIFFLLLVGSVKADYISQWIGQINPASGIDTNFIGESIIRLQFNGTWNSTPPNSGATPQPAIVHGSPSYSGNIATFNGNGQAITYKSGLFPYSNDFDMLTNSRTFASWVFVVSGTNTAGQSFGVFGEKGGIISGDGIGAGFYHSGGVAFTRMISNGVNYITYGGSISISNWHHVVSVFDRDGESYTYVDNVLVGTPLDISGQKGSYYKSTYYMVIGARWHSSGLNAYYNGKLDNFYVFDRVLSTDEIQYLYDEGHD